VDGRLSSRVLQGQMPMGQVPSERGTRPMRERLPVRHTGADRFFAGGLDDGSIRRKRRGGLDQPHIVFEPFRAVHAHGGRDSAFVAVDSNEPAALDRALRYDHFVGEGWQSDRLDVDPKLAGPEGRHGQVRTAQRCRVDHVVRRHLGLRNCIAPVFERQQLILEKGMRKARDITSHEHVVGDDAVHVEDTAASIAAHATRAGG
jgi:hypothetical protein